MGPTSWVFRRQKKPRPRFTPTKDPDAGAKGKGDSATEGRSERLHPGHSPMPRDCGERDWKRGPKKPDKGTRCERRTGRVLSGGKEENIFLSFTFLNRAVEEKNGGGNGKAPRTGQGRFSQEVSRGQEIGKKVCRVSTAKGRI